MYSSWGETNHKFFSQEATLGTDYKALVDSFCVNEMAMMYRFPTVEGELKPQVQGTKGKASPLMSLRG